MVKIYLEIDFYNLFLVSFTEAYLMRNKINLKYTIQSFNKCMQLGNLSQSRITLSAQNVPSCPLIASLSSHPRTLATTDLFLSL